MSSSSEDETKALRSDIRWLASSLSKARHETINLKKQISDLIKEKETLTTLLEYYRIVIEKLQRKDDEKI